MTAFLIAIEKYYLYERLTHTVLLRARMCFPHRHYTHCIWATPLIAVINDGCWYESQIRWSDSIHDWESCFRTLMFTNSVGGPRDCFPRNWTTSSAMTGSALKLVESEDVFLGRLWRNWVKNSSLASICLFGSARFNTVNEQNNKCHCPWPSRILRIKWWRTRSPVSLRWPVKSPAQSPKGVEVLHADDAEGVWCVQNVPSFCVDLPPSLDWRTVASQPDIFDA